MCMCDRNNPALFCDSEKCRAKDAELAGGHYAGLAKAAAKETAQVISTGLASPATTDTTTETPATA